MYMGRDHLPPHLCALFNRGVNPHQSNLISVLTVVPPHPNLDHLLIAQSVCQPIPGLESQLIELPPCLINHLQLSLVLDNFPAQMCG